ncbi:DNA polymerase III subunit gamma/tau [Candidatus Saccharibacteria bacterium]|nr:DNA polymerase III subunit gamma/tau [Candidatus Saccharibacteria bacterium]
MAVLYRKYRSKSLDELVGQEHITLALKKAIDQGKISHAYLFTGPKGTGKTSVARILAYQLNNLPYDESATNLDIIEIDAASNRRIDEIRDLREKVNIAPTSSKYKVYIIDEVHMLTKEAFNALLKTIEEPPEHAIFILATTELHKVPETIVSRTQRFSFKPIEKSKIISHLRSIAEQENINIEDDALEMIAEHANGGFRDAISLLDQVRSLSENIKKSDIQDAIGAPSTKLLTDLWESLKKHSSSTKNLLNQLYDQGFHAPIIAQNLLMLAIEEHNVGLARMLLEVNSSHDPKTSLLLLSLAEANEHPSKQIEDTEAQQKPVSVLAQKPKTKEVNKEIKIPAKVEKREVPSSEESDLWSKILESLKEGNHAIYGPLRLAKTEFNGNMLRIGLAFPFHIKRIQESKNFEVLEETARRVGNKELNIEVFRLESGEIPETKPKLQDIQPTDTDESLMSDPLSIVKNVFGDAQPL